jgi:hypothetical protein
MSKKYYVKNSYGLKIDMDVAISLMDNELREFVAYQLGLSSDQEFFDTYAKEHEKKFGEEWELTKKHPCY